MFRFGSFGMFFLLAVRIGLAGHALSKRRPRAALHTYHSDRRRLENNIRSVIGDRH